MPQPALPADDLYARLSVPTDASPEAIEVAWRALLRRHHPDVAGPDGLEQAKRINVAHDWLSDPALRARYDREHGLRQRDRPARRRTSRLARARRRRAPGRPPRARPRAGPWTRPRVVARFLDRVAALTPTEIDRLALAEPPPIAFGATIRRFLPPEQRAALDEVEDAVGGRLPPGADRPTIRDAIDGYATELVLGRFLDELLTEPFRERAHERLTRGWDAAVGQPRYGPNGAAVEALVERIGPAGRGRAPAPRGDRGRPPRHGGPLAARRLARRRRRAPDLLDPRRARRRRPRSRPGCPAPERARARLAAGRLAHLLVLRHAFAPAAFDALTGAVATVAPAGGFGTTRAASGRRSLS